MYIIINYNVFFFFIFLLRVRPRRGTGQGPSVHTEPGRLQAVHNRDAEILVRPAADVVRRDVRGADARPAPVPGRGAVHHRRLERRVSDRRHRNVRHEIRPLDAHFGRRPVRTEGLPRHGGHGPLYLRVRGVRRPGVFQLVQKVLHGDENVGRNGADELQKVCVRGRVDEHG